MSSQQHVGYCFKEHKKVTIKNPTYQITQNNRPAVSGTCPNDGGKIFRLISPDDPNIPAEIKKKLLAAKEASARKKEAAAKKGKAT